MKKRERNRSKKPRVFPTQKNPAPPTQLVMLSPAEREGCMALWRERQKKKAALDDVHKRLSLVVDGICKAYGIPPDTVIHADFEKAGTLRVPSSIKLNGGAVVEEPCPS